MVNDNSARITRTHNIFLAIMTIASVGTTVESYTQGWEFWVPPLIIIGLIASWSIHVVQYRQVIFRENFYLFYSLMVSFYHGVHDTSYFDLIVISALIMVIAALLRRKSFLLIFLAEFYALLLMQTVQGARAGRIVFDSLTVSRILLHCIVELCIYKVLTEVIINSEIDTAELVKRNEERAVDKVDMEDFLVNISHELRTPVNVINGLSSIIFKNEKRDDVGSIMDAGLRLSHQLEDIQDYSEIQRGDVLIDEDTYSITSLVNDVVADYRESNDRNDLDVIIDLDPNVPAIMKGDRRRITKIIRHLLSNAIKFTRRGGVLLKITAVRHDLDVNLLIEVIDTGIGMTQSELEKISRGSYQGNRKRNRNTGGIGLGLPIVYGFVRRMNGFVSFDSAKGKGTTARVSISQTVIDPTPCMVVKNSSDINVATLINPKKYSSAAVWEFYKTMTVDSAERFHVNLVFTPGQSELKKVLEKNEIEYLFTGENEYADDPAFFDKLSKKVTVAVLVSDGFNMKVSNRILLVPKPIYGFPFAQLLNGEVSDAESSVHNTRPALEGMRALVVDDEPLNLVVAEGLFGEYDMIVDKAQSGPEAIRKYQNNEYDVVFMDHMMPEMDGVEAMKRISDIASHRGKSARVIALTANVVSGAKEMFLKEGFAGFIGKPIEISEFERVMKRVFPGRATGSSDRKGGGV